MKKFTNICIGTLAFILVFYNQSPGVNVALISVIIWLLLYFQPGKNKKDAIFWLLSVCVFFSALSFAWYGDEFSFFGLVLSVLLLGIKFQYPKLNILLFPILWFINYSSFIFRVFFFKYWLPKSGRRHNLGKKILSMVLIPAFFTLLFIFVYAAGSDIFQSFFGKITLDFNFPQIIFLACLGFFLLFNFWFMLIPKKIIQMNSFTHADFGPHKLQVIKPTFPFLEIDFERKSGEISLVLLNILLLFFIVTYNYEQFFTSQGAGSLSSEIHQRVAVIIFSIVMAIAVIMFYFKSSFNFDQNATLLKKLALIWVVLNAILIISAFIKNSEYVLNFGLTFKRLGVYIFLILTLVGLCLTYLKIKLKKTNIFLLSKMMWIFFFSFVITSWINFSWIVTKYNIAYNKSDDIEYLRSLDFNKQILYNTYKNDPLWIAYFENQNSFIESEKENELLSASLYYYYVDAKK
jgi:hypothetical protein